jgi:hypothetical protein
MALLLVYRRGAAEHRQLQIFFVAAVIVLCVLMTPVSSWVWKAAPMLHYVQFPWRFLAPASVCLSIIVASAGCCLRTKSFRHCVFLGVFILLLVVPNWHHSRPLFYIDVDLAKYRPEEIARAGVETTANREFEPRWVQLEPEFRNERLKMVFGEAELRAIRSDPVKWAAKLDARSPGLAEARLFYFPGWEVQIDGRTVQSSVEPMSGRIQFPLSAGTHDLLIIFRRTAAQLIGQLVSLAALSACGIGFFGTRRRQNTDPLETAASSVSLTGTQGFEPR